MTNNSRIEPIERATGISWDEWLVFLEGFQASTQSHFDISRIVAEKLDDTVENPGWWAQAVAVAYEQHIGRRLPGQAQDGTFQTSISKATGLDMAELMEAWLKYVPDDAELQSMIAGEQKVSGTDKRRNWRTKLVDGSSLLVTSEPKQSGTAALIFTESRLQSAAANDAAKAKLAALAERFLVTLGE